jgi:hypothetical protein
MARRKVAIESPADQTGGSPNASPLPSGKDYLGKFIVYALFFGIVGAVLSSRLPLLIGAMLFFSSDDFIAWALGKVGIRLVPDSLGANFVSAAVFLTCAWVALTYGRDSLPAWLSEWLPPRFSWTMVIGGALGCALLAGMVAGVTRLLSWAGMNVRPDSLSAAIVRAVISFTILGLLYLLLSTPMVAAWFGVH